MRSLSKINSRRLVAVVVAALLSCPGLVVAGPKEARLEKRRLAKAMAQERAEAPVPAKPTHDAASPWHDWTNAQDQSLKGKFIALESGLLTVEDEQGQRHRIPVTLLKEDDRKFAEECRQLQPRPHLAADVIARAAAKLDETIFAALTKAKEQPHALTDDATFARRLHLDLIGRIPTATELKDFLADARPDKRALLIDSLLNSPGYTMQMFNWFADMLRVKDDYGKGAKAFLFEDWLKDMVSVNRPWDALVKDMLTADGKLSESGPAGFLLRDAQMPLDGVSNLLTTFLGADVSCAQCHDHPMADWTQKDFYQIAAFFGATDGYHEDVFKQIRRVAKNSNVAARGQVLQMLGSNAFDLVDLPKNQLKFPADYKYDNAKPKEPVTPELISWTKEDRLSPAYKVEVSKPRELRDEFAKWMTSPDNPRFATAIANRLWKKLFGLAVQEPVSDLDDPKLASNPELLAQLTLYMKQAKFDLREFQRVLCNTAAYQRQASPAPDLAKGHYFFNGPLVRRMSAEQAWDSILTLVGGAKIDQSLLRRGDELKLTIVDGKVTEEAAKEVMAKMQEEGVKIPREGKKKGKGGNPNQMAGFYEGAVPRNLGGVLLARASEIRQPAPESHFLRIFGQSDRMVADTNATDGSVPQMMFLMNGNVQNAVTLASSTVLQAVSRAATQPDKITILYHSFLGRNPTADESKRLATALDSGLTPADCAWALLNTREFLFVR